MYNCAVRYITVVCVLVVCLHYSIYMYCMYQLVYFQMFLPRLRRLDVRQTFGERCLALRHRCRRRTHDPLAADDDDRRQHVPAERRRRYRRRRAGVSTVGDGDVGRQPDVR